MEIWTAAERLFPAVVHLCTEAEENIFMQKKESRARKLWEMGLQRNEDKS